MRLFQQNAVHNRIFVYDWVMGLELDAFEAAMKGPCARASAQIAQYKALGIEARARAVDVESAIAELRVRMDGTEDLNDEATPRMIEASNKMHEAKARW